jgi:hypothetical protein
MGVRVSLGCCKNWHGICEWYAVLACKLIVQAMKKILFVTE